MRLVLPEEMRRIEDQAGREHGLTSEILMEAAGALIARELLTSVSLFVGSSGSSSQGPKIVFLIGPGKNGADGLVAARHLLQARPSLLPNVQIFANPSKPSSDELRSRQISRLLPFGVKIQPLEDFDCASGSKYLVVDALFGTGVQRPLQSPYLEVIHRLRASESFVVSVDIPSGLNAATGQIMGAAVKASLTLTLGFAKQGLFVSEGPRQVGRVQVLGLGIPPAEIATQGVSLLTEPQIAKWLPTRPRSGHKGTFGRVVVVGGSQAYPGAPILASQAAFRMGAGYVQVVGPSEVTKILTEVLKSNPEILVSSHLPEGHLDKSVFLVGPGLSDDSGGFCERMTEDYSATRQVWDADGLNWLAKLSKDDARFRKLLSSWTEDTFSRRLLTPHPLEAARLLDVAVEEIESDRLAASRALAKKFNSMILLKGVRTLICNGEKTWISPTGNTALSKAGSGDVLGGFIASLAAQGCKLSVAACCAAFIHGRLAERWKGRGLDERSMMPSDLGKDLGQYLAELKS
jgi:hydroxyethylthiazole kinase-like uncharacterized protein yjeF